MKTSFKVDDLVFARIKGYRPWPGRVLEIPNPKKASVFFFGTYDVGMVNLNDLWPYNDVNKDKFGKTKGKNKQFEQALLEIVEYPGMLIPQEVIDRLEPSSTSSEPPAKEQTTEYKVEDRKIWVQIRETGDFIEINLDKDRPKSFASNEDAMKWDSDRAKEALKFKSLVESGKYVPEEVLKNLEEKDDRSEEEQSLLEKWIFLKNDRNEKIEWLKVEASIAEIEIQLKKHLHPDHPELPVVIQLLQQLNSLKVTKLMLKKQPQVFETVNRLCHYLGPKNTDETLMPKVKLVKSLSNGILSKWKSYFEDLSNDNFTADFKTLILKFQESIKNMPVEKQRFMVCEIE